MKNKVIIQYQEQHGTEMVWKTVSLPYRFDEETQLATFSMPFETLLDLLATLNQVPNVDALIVDHK